MPDLPLVSIGAINYNCAQFVIETLESIKRLEYPDFELVIVDDHSTDNSVSIIKNWLKNYSGRFQFIQHEINKGVCAACNTALRYSNGKYFSLIATDDLVRPEKLSLQVPLLEQSDVDVAGVYTDAELMDESGKLIPGSFIDRHRQFHVPPSGKIYETLLQGNFIPGMTFLLKRQALIDAGGYDEQLSYEDFDMWLRIAQRHQILFSEHIVCTYRIRKGSLSATNNKWRTSDLRIYLKHTNAPLPLGKIRKIAAEAYWSNDRECLPMLKELADKTGDNYLIATSFLWHSGVSFDFGRLILAQVEASTEAGGRQNPQKRGADEVRCFADVILPMLPDALFHDLVFQLLEHGSGEQMLLVNLLGVYHNDRFVVALYLAEHFRFSREISSMIVEATKSESAGAGKGIFTANAADDAGLFVMDILPSLSREIVHEVALYIYRENREDLADLLARMKLQAPADRYLKCAWMLLKNRVVPHVGVIILGRVNGYILAGKPDLYIDLCMYKDNFEAVYRYKSTTEKPKKLK